LYLIIPECIPELNVTHIPIAIPEVEEIILLVLTVLNDGFISVRYLKETKVLCSETKVLSFIVMKVFLLKMIKRLMC
jgi:hypothetical protein